MSVYSQKAPEITIPDEAWEEIGYEENPKARLLTHFRINGLDVHLEAIEVADDATGEQNAADPAWQDLFLDYFRATGADAAFETTTIKGREYALFASPYCI